MFQRQRKQKKNEIDYSPFVERIREDSKDTSRLTLDESVSSMMSEIDVSKQTDILSGILEDERYPDIKTITGSDNHVYWYSNTYITDSNAEQLVQITEMKANIAEQVREYSRDQAKVTCLNPFPEDENQADIERVKKVISELEIDDQYTDIHCVEGSSGVLYLYSDDYLSDSYAKTLIMVEENDPQTMIAGAVRDESRLYPRPTNIEQFLNPIYNINREELLAHVDDLMNREDFEDIKLIEASTGTRYLYSSHYMDDRYARTLVEWKEVGEFENP